VNVNVRRVNVGRVGVCMMCTHVSEEGGNEKSSKSEDSPMYLCTCASEEGVDGEGVTSETPSLLSYTL
jgi:hypothetical protein